MKKIRLFFTVLMLLVAGMAYGQNVTVSGSVKDASDGSPIPFAAIHLKGTTTGASADEHGNFSISVPADGTLVASSIGYMTTEAPVAGKKTINFSLDKDSEYLDETLVIAYGVQKKSSFTGSATMLSGEKLKRSQASNVSKSLEGAVAGLQVALGSGTPGSSGTMYIRGLGSMSAAREPLIVVDGTPYEGSLNSIPSQDIESITVLKDAAANSMYGARGSNGVIMITTKKGTAGKVNISFDAKVGVNSRGVPTYDVIDNPGDYYEMFWEAIRNNVYYNGIYSLGQANVYASASIIDEYAKYNIYKGIANDKIIDPQTGKLNPAAKELKWTDNWNNDIFRPGIRQEYNVTASGGSDKTQGYMSVSYLDDQGYLPMSGFTRISVRGKVDQTIGKRIKAGLNVAYSNTNMKQFNSSEESNYSNIFNYAQKMPPIFPIYKYDLETGERLYDKDGSTLYDWGETRPAATNTNAYGQLMTSKYNTIRDNISSRGYVDINILKDLKVSINAAYDVFNTKTERYMTPVGGDAKEVGGRGTQIVSRYTAINANQLISYTPTFGEHSLSILLGHETKSDNSYSMNGSMTKFVNQSVSDFNNALVYDGLYSSSSSYFLEGVFARAEYDYASRYFLSASYRMDGSSRFAPKNRWGSFWAVGGSWNIKQESFLRDSDAINLLKIKASYGTQGNDNIGYTVVYQDLYDIIRVDGEASLTKVFRAAPDVTWEKSNNFNVGFESRFWNRLTINADFFIKKTKDMIYLRPLAPSQGDPSEQLVNDMDMQNTGVEFEVSADVVKTKNVVWNISLNGTHYKNAITKLPADKPQEGYQTGNYWREVGGPVYQFNLREYAGVDPATGLPQYNKYDDEGNVTLVNKFSDATLRKTGKSPVPDLFGGFSTSLNLYGFDLSASFAYQIGGYVIDSGYMSLMGGGDISDNWHKDIFNRWTPENTSTDVPRVELGNSEIAQTSTRFLTKASYLSLRNVTIGYSLPSKLLERAKINTVRFYLTGDNLWYLSARRGLDVRQSFDGTIGYNYSAIRTVSFGVNLVF